MVFDSLRTFNSLLQMQAGAGSVDAIAPTGTPTTEFVNWLSEQLPNLRVKLHTKAWKGAPAVKKEVVGIPAVVANYQWPALWTHEGVAHKSMDWTATMTSLLALRELLHESCVNTAASDDAALAACACVLQWGGDRNSKKGAMPFLRGLQNKGQLVAYLRRCRTSLMLDTATMTSTECVLEMNSMLTKVHALLSNDGLPIYDSRVAGAAAALVELFRRDSGLIGPAPADLCFPSVGGGGATRRATCLFPNASWHRVIWYRTSKDDAQRWADAQVRLGRILTGVLQKNPQILADQGDLSARSRALEAGLFMIGYDLNCLRTDHQ